MKCRACGYERNTTCIDKSKKRFLEVELSNEIKINEWYDMQAKLWACPMCHTVKLASFNGYDLAEGEVR